MKSVKTIIILITVPLVIGVGFWFSYNFASGSYPYAETYELDFSEEEVKQAVNEFKQEHPEYTVPKVTIENKGFFDLLDGQSKEPSHWYNIYFYYKNENRILYTWTRPFDENKTAFALVSINNGLNIGNWKEINKDFSCTENKKEKKKFEEQILNKIIENLKSRKY